MQVGDPIQFGFLYLPSSVAFSQGQIVPVEDYAKRAKILRRLINVDRYLYPPTVKEFEPIKGGGFRTKPRTKRPAHQFRQLASHELILSAKGSELDVREMTAGFVIHFLGFTFKTRVQFADWFIDGRVPIETESIWAGHPAILGNRLTVAYDFWSSWNTTERQRYLNILYMHARSEVYEWDWERFTIEYMVLDACWRMGKELLGFKARKHAERLEELYSHFGIGQQLIRGLDEVAKLRNDLFHEVFWLEGRPTHVNPRRFGLGFDVGIRLHWLNRHVIAGLLGFDDVWD